MSKAVTRAVLDVLRTVERRGFYVVIHFSGTVSTGQFQKIRNKPIDVQL